MTALLSKFMNSPVLHAAAGYVVGKIILEGFGRGINALQRRAESTRAPKKKATRTPAAAVPRSRRKAATRAATVASSIA